MPSFDTVCEPDLAEVRNAVDNAAKEIGTRFDFKGTPAAIALKGQEIVLTGSSDFQLGQVLDVLRAKMAKRGIDPRFLDLGPVAKAGGDTVRQTVTVRKGLPAEPAKKVQRIVKDSRLKLQAAIQGDLVRVSGAKRDDLQAAIALIRKEMDDWPLSFTNFRD